MFTQYLSSLSPEEQHHVSSLIKSIKHDAAACGIQLTEDDWKAVLQVLQKAKDLLQVDTQYMEKHLASPKMKIILA